MTEHQIYFGGLFAILAIYYGLIYVKFRPRKVPQNLSLETLPLRLSPVLARWLWKGKLHWKSLVVIGFHAVNLGVYEMEKDRWKRSLRFRLHQVDFFHRLSNEEKAAFSMGKHAPLEDIIFSPVRQAIHSQMLMRIYEYGEKAFERYFLPFNWLVYGGFALHCIWTIVMIYTVQWPESVPMNAMAVVFILCALFTAYWMRDMLYWENRRKAWRIGIFLIIGSALSFVFLGMINVYLFPLLIHGLAYHHLPRLSQEGRELRQKIVQYRNHLLQLKKENNMTPEQVPYAFALDVAMPLGHLSNGLLNKEEPIVEGWLDLLGETLSGLGEIVGGLAGGC